MSTTKRRSKVKKHIKKASKPRKPAKPAASKPKPPAFTQVDYNYQTSHVRRFKDAAGNYRRYQRQPRQLVSARFSQESLAYIDDVAKHNGGWGRSKALELIVRLAAQVT